jgi:ArsR family transcriptional regulator, arsenate/arsenite/antimonite-responsive transcriptional repressor / arsenate reductase (thioredoxin)
MNDPVPSILSALAHPLRWALVQVLVKSGDLRVFELSERTSAPQNVVSYHLKRLRDAEAVRVRRSESDSRDQYYHVDVPRLRELLGAAGQRIHPLVGSGLAVGAPMPLGRALFVCTHNSARSQMAEGWARMLGGGAVAAFSAGSHPLAVHPDAVAVMAEHGVDLRGHHPNGVSEYDGQTFDAVVTVCDRAREQCPLFDGARWVVHWSLPDPLAIAKREARLAAFRLLATELRWRVEHLLAWLTRPAVAP